MNLPMGLARVMNPEAATERLFSLFQEAILLVAASDPTYDGWALPKRITVVPGGALAWDKEQLTINYMGMSPGMPGAELKSYVNPVHLLTFYDFEITILRNTPNISGQGNPPTTPTATALATSATKNNFDSALMIAALITLYVNGAVVPVGIPFTFGPCEPVGPAGDLAGFHCPVQFQAGMSPDGRF